MFGRKKPIVVEPTYASISEQICEDGTLTVIFALAFLLFYVIARLLIWQGTRSENERAGQAKSLYHPKQEGFLWKFERWLVMPFVSDTIQEYVLQIFGTWFVLTIPMAITRYYKGEWALELLSQHGPFNFLAYMVGCKGKDLRALTYTDVIPTTYTRPKVPPERGSGEELDPFFVWHLVAGTAWLFIGFLQIYRSKKGGWSPNEVQNMKIHKMFGKYLALPALMLHLICSTQISIRNPVNQPLVVQSQYIAMLFENSLLCYFGIKYAKQGAKEQRGSTKRETLMNKHKLRMVSCWVQSIFGSGAIRLTLWFLWLIAHFFQSKPELMARIDRTTCQTAADAEGELGDAKSCWVPVMLNLTLTYVLSCWLLWQLFFIPNGFTSSLDQERFKKHWRSAVACLLLMIITVTVGMAYPKIDDIMEWILIPCGVISHVNVVYDLTAEWSSDKKKKSPIYKSLYMIGLADGNNDEINEAKRANARWRNNNIGNEGGKTETARQRTLSVVKSRPPRKTIGFNNFVQGS